LPPVGVAGVLSFHGAPLQVPLVAVGNSSWMPPSVAAGCSVAVRL